MEAPGALVMVAALRLGTMRATPRSAILANMPELRSTFLADRSRWMIGGEWLCRKDRPRATSCRTERFRATGMWGLVSGGGSGSSISWRLVSSRSITSAGSREPGKKHTPRNWTMCGWRRVLISWHSCTNSRDAFSINSSGIWRRS